MDVETIAIILVSGIVCVMILMTLGFLCIGVVKAWKGEGHRKGNRAEAEETQLIQEIHHGLLKMEERVESLETLIVDRERKKPSDMDRELR